MPISFLGRNVNWHWIFPSIKQVLCNILPEKAKKKFSKSIPYGNSCRLMCKQCDHYFGSIKSNQQHSVVCRMNESSAVEKFLRKMARLQRVAAPRQQELLCIMDFQVLECHWWCEIFDCKVEYIDELVAKSGSPILTNTDPLFRYE